MDVILLVSIVFFYVVIALTGILAAKFTKNRKADKPAELMIVGAKDIGLWLGISTMTGN